MRVTFLHASAGLLAFGLLTIGVASTVRPTTPARAADAAARWLSVLPPELRARAQLQFEGDTRLKWNFLPGDRPGVSIKEMSAEQRRAAHDLLRSSLSARGSLKVQNIMDLETVLREMEQAAGGDGAGRDAERYFFVVWGTPGSDKPWGWRIEGHHVSVNFTSVKPAAGPEIMAVTPAFLGASPAEIRQGRRAGTRVLSAEEDLARELVKTFDEPQKSKAIINTVAPADVIWVPARTEGLGTPVGLPASGMTEPQKALLLRLISEYAGNLQHDLEHEQMDRMMKAGMDKIHFAWAGSIETGQGHYYRIHGPTFTIEYDNTQNDANHVHTLWRDPDRDFGRDLLKEHYEKSHLTP
jgi:hypothetical protein